MLYLPSLVKNFVNDFALTEANMDLLRSKTADEAVLFLCNEYNAYYMLGHDTCYTCEEMHKEFLRFYLQGPDRYLADWEGLKRILTNYKLQATIDKKVNGFRQTYKGSRQRNA
jgi:hypothetical protein